jgi:glyoxylase-like metal-dependent hydrolase (beta-lactamase superfamily II)/8-oxo-dGTP pyrophosphatase MutT (NUDIX family)
MRESVSAVFTTEDQIFFIKRQNYLAVFPGYYATPGGKVDQTDSIEALPGDIWPAHIKPQILHALIREVKEELNYDLVEAIAKGEVLRIDDIGLAITPEFNPYRFKNYYIKIMLKKPHEFDIDLNEVEFGEWNTPANLIERYRAGHILAVPPAVTLLKTFAENPQHAMPIEMTLPHDPETEVPMIESIYGVRQYLPLSHTFPPANRTNSFIIGDEDQVKYLIDPSPRDEAELEKFIKSVSKVGFDRIFITHHHPDHYEFSRDIALRFKVPMEMSQFTYTIIGAEYFKGIEITLRKEGDVITKSLGHDVRVYEVPGHDEGQLALAPDNMSWFLVGDLIQTIGTVVIGGPEGDMQKYFHSLNRVIDLNPKNLIPSHGIIIGGTNKLVQTLKHRQEREDQIKELLGMGRSLKEILEVIYVGLKPELLPYAMKTIEAHITKINNDAKIL